MRKIKPTAQYKRDFKREKRGQHRTDLEERLFIVFQLLTTDEPLPPSMHDHSLNGNLKDFRDCHIKPDLVLIYRKIDDNVLELVRLGSHSELGL
ncbi:MAG: type II toxin-antitoxin system YafQ family toxin [Alphaproteobacteria bacterium]|nr:type II toxin-antitoxin system YafQ family toxin [Alphaproteobacteria bacterium]